MLERIANGRTDLVFEYMERGNAATAKDESGRPLILWCAYHGDVSAIRFLLANGEKLETLGDNFDLNGAAFHGHWQLCQFLIENGIVGKNDKVKVLGRGELKSKVTVEAHAFSTNATQAIEKVGGTATTVK